MLNTCKSEASYYLIKIYKTDWFALVAMLSVDILFFYLSFAKP